MRIAYHYGSLAGGGVERRMADLYRHLTLRGDEVWIVGLSFASGGWEILCRQGGVPEERILVAPPETPYNQTYHLWSRATLENLKPDIIDAQWCATPIDYPSTAVATIHGEIPLPQPGVFDGILFVSQSMVGPTPGQEGPVVAVENWVDLDEHPFNENLPTEGVCFLGREYKSENADMVSRQWDGMIDCYSDNWTGEHPPNMIYQGYGDPCEVFPKYRVCFTSGLAAMESLAAGRLTIVGQPHRFHRGDYRLATPSRMEQMSPRRFGDMGPIDEAPAPTMEQRLKEFQDALAPGYWLAERRVIRDFLDEHHDAATQIGLVRDFYEDVLA